MTAIRWGLLGTARHTATSILPAMRAAASGTAYAVASRDADRARAFAAQHGIPHSYGSYDELLADPSVDAVYIALPNKLHAPWAIRAAEAGKPVLCEKPISLNAAEAEAIVEAFASRGLTLAEAFQWRHHPQDQRIRALVREGAIGDLRLIQAGFSFMLDREGDVRWDPALGGGALYDVGCYPIALARFMTGAEPLSVTAHAHWAASGVDDAVVATLEFPGDVLAVINCGFNQPLRRWYEVTGTAGTLAAPVAYSLRTDREGRILYYDPDNTLVKTEPMGAHDSYALLVEDFNRALIDRRPPLFPGEDAIGNMRVIDAIYAAARSGQRVAVGG